MLGMILMGIVFFYAFSGCVGLYAMMTAEAEPKSPEREAWLDELERRGR